jgi:hypothetical protein
MESVNASYMITDFTVHSEMFNLYNSCNHLIKITSKTLFFVAYLFIVPFESCEMERSQISVTLCFDV